MNQYLYDKHHDEWAEKTFGSNQYGDEYESEDEHEIETEDEEE